VRLILANLLAEKFDSIPAIDWATVAGYKEFSGHTETSLRKLLHTDLMLAAVKHLKAPRSNLTLDQIAKTAMIKYSDVKKLPDRVRKRQMEIIEYWERKVKADHLA